MARCASGESWKRASRPSARGLGKRPLDARWSSAIRPFYGAMCLALLLVTYIPALSLWLPKLMK
ncbi:MAG: hypothetical protein EXR39_02535 [Betaproteobacteria bacterium]|nr:hypothetical protein [Betaproteobacteria bacterium]